jgi:hypothetical protein
MSDSEGCFIFCNDELNCAICRKEFLSYRPRRLEAIGDMPTVGTETTSRYPNR